MDSWHTRRSALYVVQVLRGTSSIYEFVSIRAYSVEEAYARLRGPDCTPVGIWAVN